MTSQYYLFPRKLTSIVSVTKWKISCFLFLLPCVSVLNENNLVNILFIIQRTDHKNKTEELFSSKIKC